LGFQILKQTKRKNNKYKIYELEIKTSNEKNIFNDSIFGFFLGKISIRLEICILHILSLVNWLKMNELIPANKKAMLLKNLL